MPLDPSTRSQASPDALRAAARALMGRALGFRDCPPQILDALHGLGQLRHLARGEFTHRRGDPPRTLYLVIIGALEASILHADGQRHLLGLGLPGDFFGLISMVDDHCEGHDIVARVPTSVLAFPMAAFREIRAREPSLVAACERQIVSRARLMFERVYADSHVSLGTRTANMLLTLASLYGQRDAASGHPRVELPQADLADWLGMSRQRTNHALKSLEAEGLISLSYGTITIVDREALESRSQTPSSR